MSLSGEQLRGFRERGYFNLGRVFDTSALAELGAAYDAALEKPMRIGERGKSKFEP